VRSREDLGKIYPQNLEKEKGKVKEKQKLKNSLDLETKCKYIQGRTLYIF